MQHSGLCFLETQGVGLTLPDGVFSAWKVSITGHSPGELIRVP
jgi:hypothetical protein